MSMRILQELAVAAEMTDTQLSKAAMRGFEIELEVYPEEQVIRALARCRRELKRRLTLADILERLEGTDGRPSANEAWATALQGFDEAATVILNDDIAAAMEAARPIIAERDKVGARMAFIGAYERIVQDARERKKPVHWWASMGTDQHAREAAVRQGIERGLLSPSQVKLLPPPVNQEFHTAIAGMLTHKPDDEQREKIRQRLLDLRNAIGKG